MVVSVKSIVLSVRARRFVLELRLIENQYTRKKEKPKQQDTHVANRELIYTAQNILERNSE